MLFILLHIIFSPHHLRLRAILSLRPKPAAIKTTQLKIYSPFRPTSTSRREQPETSLFVPIDACSREITWYCWVPKDYDAGNLDHARNYVTTGVLGRILRDYFGFEVQFVQNVTDVDDKQPVTMLLPRILRIGPTHAKKEIMSLVFKERERKCSPSAKPEEEEKVILDERSTKSKMHVSTLHAVSFLLQKTTEDLRDFRSATSSILLPYLDSANQGREYSPEVFSNLTSFWENHFNEDMATLNVLPPTMVTHVSEFIPENVAFEKKLVDKGFAYPRAEGSVYFDIAAYEAAGHHYAKLQPWNKGNEILIVDDEGALASDKTTTLPNTVETGAEGKPKPLASKKKPQDFALWKAFKAEKPGEPSQDSPRRKGRPGWHIECAVMGSEVLDGRINIHSGGIE
ncbi:unnamed protein product [Tuber aestivum]|uniref:tRNA synthetases class I catalytic domain-containing protein n=1 Tax=Tuber aestivum TaxID=59557 RepID=A0A292PJ77_9PEZI|nr:unnamed protein product [Tuber aestivum]